MRGGIRKNGTLVVAGGTQFTINYTAGNIGQRPGTGDIRDKSPAGIALNCLGGNSTAGTSSNTLG